MWIYWLNSHKTRIANELNSISNSDVSKFQHSDHHHLRASTSFGGWELRNSQQNSRFKMLWFWRHEVKHVAGIQSQMVTGIWLSAHSKLNLWRDTYPGDRVWSHPDFITAILLCLQSLWFWLRQLYWFVSNKFAKNQLK